MDQRITIKSSKGFLELLQTLMYKNEVASILFEEDGLDRAEGVISEILLKPEEAFVVLEGTKRIRIDSLIGVNGLFKADYTEC